jgi:hypothetical protein
MVVESHITYDQEVKHNKLHSYVHCNQSNLWLFFA